MKRRAKPKSIPLSSRSDRTKRRLAMALAWEALDWPKQNDLLRQAGNLLDHLKGIV